MPSCWPLAGSISQQLALLVDMHRGTAELSESELEEEDTELSVEARLVDAVEVGGVPPQNQSGSDLVERLFRPR